MGAIIKMSKGKRNKKISKKSFKNLLTNHSKGDTIKSQLRGNNLKRKNKKSLKNPLTNQNKGAIIKAQRTKKSLVKERGAKNDED